MPRTNQNIDNSLIYVDNSCLFYYYQRKVEAQHPPNIPALSPDRLLALGRHSSLEASRSLTSRPRCLHPPTEAWCQHHQDAFLRETVGFVPNGDAKETRGESHLHELCPQGCVASRAHLRAGVSTVASVGQIARLGRVARHHKTLRVVGHVFEG